MFEELGVVVVTNANSIGVIVFFMFLCILILLGIVIQLLRERKYQERTEVVVPKELMRAVHGVLRFSKAVWPKGKRGKRPLHYKISTEHSDRLNDMWITYYTSAWNLYRTRKPKK